MAIEIRKRFVKKVNDKGLFVWDNYLVKMDSYHDTESGANERIKTLEKFHEPTFQHTLTSYELKNRS